MPERRSLKRWPLAVYPRVFEKESGALLGRVADITVEGLLLVAEEALTPGKVMHLRIELPQLNGSAEPSGVQAEVKWCRPSANPALFDVGLRFVHPGLETVRAIQAAVDELGLGEF